MIRSVRIAVLVAVVIIAGCQITPEMDLHLATPAQPLPDNPTTMGERTALELPPANSDNTVADNQGPALIEAPAPAVVATPPEPDLWRDLKGAMHLPRHLDNKRVQQELAWLKRHPGYIRRLESRLQTYLPYLYTQTQLRGMPAELALLPVVESALDTFAFSHGGAAGPWQFISGTARQYGLPINTWYDGRRDIVASTDAALDYLSDLHARFGDWYLALAGYNAGQGNVSKALRKNPGAHFFDLRLPRETRAYVPRLLALAEVVAHPDKYGLKLPQVVPGETFATLETHSQFQMDKLAGALGLDLEALYKWNPALNQWATPPNGPHRIIVPIELDLAQAQAQIDAIPAKARVDWTKIKIRKGDTLSTIARRHGTDIASLRTANNLHSNKIRAGRELLIPMNAQALASGPQNFTRGRGQVSYKVQRGDSLWSIAKSHRVSLVSLMRTNHIGPRDTLNVGRSLSIPGTANAQRVIRKVRYKVRRGDSLARIASKFSVTVNQIVSWNDLDRSKFIQPGQGLLVYVNVTGR